MKKKATRILLAVLLLALAASLLAACDPAHQEGGSGGGTVSTTYYTVSFDTAGGSTIFGSYNVSNVPRGSTVAQPKRADGSVAVPTRKGYTFDHWSYNGSEFVFSDTATDDSPATPVTEDITLTAVWTANKYTLRLNPSDPELPPYNGGLTIAGVDGAFADPVDKTIDYDTAADDFSLDTVTTDKEGDYFVYWYFYDADGERKEFTVWAKEGDKTALMAARYETAGDTALYPMFHSLLPDITVTVDAAGGTGSPGTLTVKLGDTVSESALADPVREGYRFLGWSMTVDTDEDAEAQDFVLASEEEDADNSGATVVKENITLTAKWVKTVDISSAADLETVRTALSGDDEELKAEYASAEFTFSAPVTASGWTPLFDESLPFTGSVEGNGFSVTISGAADENGLFGLFGMLSGSVNDLVVLATLETAPTAETAFVGGIAAIAKDAQINGCAAHIAIAENIAFPGTVYIGAAAGASKGGLTVSGIHLDEGSTAPNMTYRTETVGKATAGASAYIGGITGGSYGTIMNGGSVSSAPAVVSAVMDATGNVYAGGLIGNSRGFTVTECYARANLTVTGSTVYVGGLAGRSNTGLFSRSSCVGDSVGDKITATGSDVYAGGLVGLNGAAIDNCRADIAISASATSKLRAGGVAGSTDSHDIDSCYITGSITAEGSGEDSAVYAAGVFGEALLDASFSRIYTETDITVTAAGGATADFLIARRSSKTIEFEKVFRFANMTVTVNEKAVEADEEEPEGVSVLAEDKRVNGWALGSDYLDLDGGYWEYADETGAHPSLIPFWAEDEETPEEGEEGSGEEGSGEEGSGESGEEGSGEEGSGESGETA